MAPRGVRLIMTYCLQRLLQITESKLEPRPWHGNCFGLVTSILFCGKAKCKKKERRKKNASTRLK